jgi:hypothetical protein
MWVVWMSALLAQFLVDHGWIVSVRARKGKVKLARLGSDLVPVELAASGALFGRWSAPKR